jgi:ppGpp synthetase/RelA/SpoT-type nucleotidyltranferase
VKFKRNDTGRFLQPGLWEKFKGHTFEIQVRSSMLLDSWAEVRHDITYKALGGFPGRSERELLDTIKGVVISMEVLLNHLLDVHEDRIKSDETKFESMELFEQALVRALPQLAHVHEGI